MIDEQVLRCKYCGKLQWEKEESTSPAAPETSEEAAGFMQAPSLEDMSPAANVQSVEPVAVRPQQTRPQSDSVYPPPNNPAQEADSLSVPREHVYTAPDSTGQNVPPYVAPQPSVMGYVPPAGVPEEEAAPVQPEKKKKNTGKKIAGVMSALLILVVFLAVGWYFSNHNRFDLQWEQTERDVVSCVSGKLDGEKLDLENSDTSLAMGDTLVDNEDVDSRYFKLEEFEDVGEAELVCHFENKKLSGVELFSENGEALITYICDTFDIDRNIMESQAQMEYKGTYVVLLDESNGARAVFADTTYGGACSVALESYFGI